MAPKRKKPTRSVPSPLWFTVVTVAWLINPGGMAAVTSDLPVATSAVQCVSPGIVTA